MASKSADLEVENTNHNENPKGQMKETCQSGTTCVNLNRAQGEQIPEVQMPKETSQHPAYKEDIALYLASIRK